MFIHFGEQLMGKVDQVPGLFYVSTRFFCLQLLPVIPIGSVLVPESLLVMDGSEKGSKQLGIPIKLSGKSVLFAWLRVALIVGGVMAAIAGIVELGALDEPMAGAGLLATAASLGMLWWLSYRFTLAGAERALVVAAQAGIPPELVARAFAANGRFPAVPESWSEARTEE